MKHRNENPQCYRVDVVDEVVEGVSKEETPIQPMERVPVNSVEGCEKEGEAEVEECVKQLVASEPQRDVLPKETLNQVKDEDKLAKIPELKELPSHLKYVFLSKDASKRAIIKQQEMIISRCLSWIKCWKGWLDKHSVVSWMGIRGTTKLWWLQKTKKNLLSLVHLGCLLMEGYHSGCVMRRRSSKGASSPSSLTTQMDVVDLKPQYKSWESFIHSTLESVSATSELPLDRLFI